MTDLFIFIIREKIVGEYMSNQVWKPMVLYFQVEFINAVCRGAATGSLVGSHVGCQMS